MSVLLSPQPVGLPQLDGGEATELFEACERARRLAAVAAVDAIDLVERSGAYLDHGHMDAATMFKHVAGVSGGDAAGLKKIRKLVGSCALIGAAWRDGDLNVDQAAVLARAYANPRVRLQMETDESQRWFLGHTSLGFKRFQAKVARWVDLHDDDGSAPAPDPSHVRRDVSMVQDHFAKTWTLRGTFGANQGAVINQALESYIEAAFHADWADAETEHGPLTSKNLLARTDAQRRADAFAQIVADAVNSDRPSAPVKTVHNIVWSSETLQEVLRRFAGGVPEPLDPDVYRCETIDGEPLDPYQSLADLIGSKWRRIVINAAGVVIDASKEQRFYTGLARLLTQINPDSCFWPGCDHPPSKCQIDHTRPAARGGTTTQSNGIPACQHHNRLKERGYTVTRDPNTGTITITTPNGDTLTTTP